MQRAVVDCREYVAVHRQERAVEAVDQLEWSGGRQRRGFARVAQVESEARTVAAQTLDQLGQVRNRQRDAGESAAPQLPQDDLEDRQVVDGQERFRQHRRIRAQPLSLSSGKNHRLHASPIVCTGRRGRYTV